VAFTALFDANVLYPAAQRDLLIRLAQTGLFRGRWTDQILDEMQRAIIASQPQLVAKLGRTRQLMCDGVPDCLVTGYEHLIDALELPDVNDRHVLAAAIRCGAQVIVTNNLSDFPAYRLDDYGIEAQSADEFIVHLVELRPALVAATLQRQADSLNNPPQTIHDVMARLERSGLRRTIAALGIHLQP
jgi:cytosine/adenosine deaminase-related metal-dependent hydrolase